MDALNLDHAPLAYSGPLSGQMCQCTACGHTFGGERGFNAHRCGEYANPGQWQGTRRCRTPAEIRAAGLEQDSRGIWRYPKPAHLAAANAELGPSGSRAATTLPGYP